MSTVKPNTPSALQSSSYVAWVEFVELTGIGEERIFELMDLGWLEPVARSEESLLFKPSDVYKTRKVDRLCSDFELPCLAGTIIVDLLERIAQLEARLRELEGRY